MASLMESLIEILEEESTSYENLLELSTDKTPIIVAGDIEKLNKITDEEQFVVSKIANLEKQREAILNDIANVINMDVKTLKLLNLIQMLDNRPEERKQLEIIHAKLRDITERMVQVNEHNRLLLNNALELVDFDMTLLQAMKAAPETANYDRGASNVGSTIGTNQGNFDAKQ